MTTLLTTKMNIVGSKGLIKTGGAMKH